MLTPFVKPRQVLSYLVLAIAPFFVSVTCSKRLRNYSVSESGGAPFSQYNDKYRTIFDYKSVDGVHGIRTLNVSSVGADKSTELWRPPTLFLQQISVINEPSSILRWDSNSRPL